VTATLPKDLVLFKKLFRLLKKLQVLLKKDLEVFQLFPKYFER